MPTPGERRALLFIAAIAALGVAARGWHERRDAHGAAPPGEPAALARQIEAVDSALAAGGARRAARSARTKAGAPTSRARREPRLDSAEAPAPRTRARPAPRALSPAAAPLDRRAAYRQRIAREDSARAALSRRLDSAERRSPSVVRRLSSRAPQAPVDLDVAAIDDIAAVPAIGRALAQRIVRDRIERGPFGSLDGLQRVRGIGPALARRLAARVTFSLEPRLERAGESSDTARRRRRPTW